MAGQPMKSRGWNGRSIALSAQATLLMGALGSIYVAAGIVCAATLVSLLGAVFCVGRGPNTVSCLAAFGFVLGVVGVTGLVLGCARLFRATQLSLEYSREAESDSASRAARYLLADVLDDARAALIPATAINRNAARAG